MLSHGGALMGLLVNESKPTAENEHEGHAPALHEHPCELK